MARTADDLRVTGRVPPHNLEAEESVLGSMMLLGDAIASVSEILKPGDFYRSAHRSIYESLIALYARGEPVDAITAVEELKRRGTLEPAGGALYIHHLVESVPTPASAVHYARIVADHALLRRLIQTSSTIIDRAYQVPEDPASLADEAEGMIYGVARHSEKDEIVELSRLVGESLEILERMHDREGGMAGIPTGFTDLDNLLQGLQPGNLVVVAARPGVGKSSLVTNIARNVAVETQVPVAMFSLEMSRVEIAMRLLCAEARIGQDRVRSMRVAAEEWPRIVEAAEVLDPAPLYIVDTGNVSIVDIRAKARRLKSGPGLGLLIVDYLQLMSSHQRTESRQQEIADISRSLKLLAKELEIPVIAVSQLNRDPERRTDKRPQLSDLRECVTGDALVVLSDGRRVPIRELVGTQPEVLSVSPEGRVVVARSDLVWRVGRRRVVQVRLASGRTVRTTREHRLLAGAGWRRVGELVPGDRVALARALPEPLDPAAWHDDEVALLGHLIGDGSYLSGQPMRYTSADDASLALVARVAADRFGAAVRRYEGRGSWSQLLISGNGNRWHPAGVNRWLRGLGIFGQRSKDKRIPAEAFRLAGRQVAILLRHLWATDGSIGVRRPGTRGGHRVYFSTASHGLAQDVAALLLRIGIVARIRTVTHEGSTWHTVDVSGAEAQARFLDVVGSFGPRVDPARRLRERLGSVSSNTNIDTLPAEVFGEVRSAMARRGISQRQMAALRGTSYGGSAHFRFAPSRATLASYAEALGEPALMAKAGSDLFWDRVLEVVDAGEEDVYDLTVPGTESWLADGIVSHNSGAIEQDSDVVMFIHREDLFSDDPAVKGVAEIVVAKHRNGPTDKIPLTFVSSLTQFRNYARGS